LEFAILAYFLPGRDQPFSSDSPEDLKTLLNLVIASQIGRFIMYSLYATIAAGCHA
jgi:hypothetical protein